MLNECAHLQASGDDAISAQTQIERDIEPRGKLGNRAAEMSQPILLTVLGGYLGAGKTTLLNHILREAGGRQLAVIVNDFGNINIDADLIEARTDNTLTLANGCICCSISAGFAEALAELSGRTPQPEQVIIEASGVADPVKIGHFANLPPYKLDGIVVVADAETVRSRSDAKYVGGQVLRQLHAADLIVLNKIDLIGEAELADLRSWLREQVPDARTLTASFGRVPLDLLIGLHAQANAPVHGHHHDHDHGAEYVSRSVTLDAPVHEAEFRAMVEAWPATVLRAKGFVHLKEDPRRRHLFQLVGRRWSLVPDQDWGDVPAQSRIVLIGLAGQFNGDELLRPMVHPRVVA
jgi:G3E family GTPase